MTGDLAAAQRHAAQALSLQPEKVEYVLLCAELDFALCKPKNLTLC